MLGAFLIALTIVIIIPIFYPDIYQQMQSSSSTSLFWFWIISFLMLTLASIIIWLILAFYRFFIRRSARGAVIV